jgi:hypothetical protein
MTWDEFSSCRLELFSISQSECTSYATGVGWIKNSLGVLRPQNIVVPPPEGSINLSRDGICANKSVEELLTTSSLLHMPQLFLHFAKDIRTMQASMLKNEILIVVFLPPKYLVCSSENRGGFVC